MHLPEDPERSPQINIVPMIDVIFAVLIFFILVSMTLTNTAGIPVNLPTAETAQPQPQQQLEVTMQADGAIFINNQPTNLDQILDDVKALVPADQPGLVVIRADAQIPHGQVVAVLDQLRRLKGIQLAIATQPME